MEMIDSGRRAARSKASRDAEIDCFRPAEIGSSCKLESRFISGCHYFTGASLFDLRPTAPPHPGVDAARGVAVVAMVLGHTLNALLAPAPRALPWVQQTWELRGLAGPLFLVVSGFVLGAPAPSPTEAPRASLVRQFGSALLWLCVGYLLNWPGWEVAQGLGGEALRARLFTFDLLPCLGVSLALVTGVMALARGTRSRVGALAVLGMGTALATAWVWEHGSAWPQDVRQMVGMPGAHYPLLPWAGFFFCGALGAHLSRPLRPGWPQGLALGALGAALLFVGRGAASWDPAHPLIVAFGTGASLVVMGAVSLLPAVLSRWIAPLGRTSLWLYALHLPLLYGWAGVSGLAERLGPTLGLLAALGVGVGLLTLGQVLAVLGRRVRMGRRPPQPRTWRARSPSLDPPGLRPGQRI